MRLYLHADGSDDADVFVKLIKLSPDGEPQLRVLIPREEPEFEREWDAIAAYAAGPARSFYGYDGCWGRLRASRRVMTTDPRVEPRYPPEDRLTPGQVVELRITLSPTAMVIRAGERLRLMVAGKDLAPLNLPGMERLDLRNAGRHVVHTGGDRPSRLVLPIVGSGIAEKIASGRLFGKP